MATWATPLAPRQSIPLLPLPLCHSAIPLSSLARSSAQGEEELTDAMLVIDLSPPACICFEASFKTPVVSPTGTTQSRWGRAGNGVATWLYSPSAAWLPLSVKYLRERMVGHLGMSHIRIQRLIHTLRHTYIHPDIYLCCSRHGILVTFYSIFSCYHALAHDPACSITAQCLAMRNKQNV